MRKLRVCICGGGHLGHALAAVIGANADIDVSVVTSKYDQWLPEVQAIYADVVVIGRVSLTTQDLATAAENADVILLACPAFLHRSLLRALVPAIKRGASIGSMPAPGFFHSSVQEMSQDVRFFVGTRSPFNCRIKTLGSIVEITGVLPFLEVAASPQIDGGELRVLLTDLLGLPVRSADSFFAATLEPSVTILHPARLYSFFEQAKQVGAKQIPRFYEGWDDAASETYLRCDAEIQLIAAHMPEPVHIRLALYHYGVSTPQLLTTRIRGLKGLPATDIPLTENGNDPDLAHRFFREDFDIGLKSVATLGRCTGVATPAIDLVLKWFDGVSSHCACEIGRQRHFLRAGLS